MAVLAAIAAAGAGLSPARSAQETTAGKDPSVFEVASIKLTTSDVMGGIVHRRQGTVV